MLLTTLFASLPPKSKRRPSERALAVAYLFKNKKVTARPSYIFNGEFLQGNYYKSYSREQKVENKMQNHFRYMVSNSQVLGIMNKQHFKENHKMYDMNQRNMKILP